MSLNADNMEGPMNKHDCTAPVNKKMGKKKMKREENKSPVCGAPEGLMRRLSVPEVSRGYVTSAAPLTGSLSGCNVERSEGC